MYYNIGYERLAFNSCNIDFGWNICRSSYPWGSSATAKGRSSWWRRWRACFWKNSNFHIVYFHHILRPCFNKTVGWPWNKGAFLCACLLWFSFPEFLLANTNLHLSWNSSTVGNSSFISNKKNKVYWTTWFQVHHSYYLYFKHCACNAGTCDIFSENIHQYWYWNIRVRILHSDYYFLGTYLHS